MLTPNEILQIINLVERAPITGREALGVAQLLQRLNAEGEAAMTPPKPDEKPE